MELDLSFLTIEERQAILGVLKRDEELRLAEQARKSALKTEIHQLRQQSVIRVGGKQKTRQCARCQTELGRLFNRGEVCPKCKHLICTTCKVTVGESSTFSWLCGLCYKQRLLPAVAGDWFYAKVDEKFKHEITGTYGSEVVRSSIRRLKSHDGVDQSSRSNPFSQKTNGVKPGGHKTSSVQPKLSNGSGSYVHAPSDRTVKQVQSSWQGSSGSEESDAEGDKSNQQKTALVSSRLAPTDEAADTRSERGIYVAAGDPKETALSQSAPGSRVTLSVVMEDQVRPAHSLDPANMGSDDTSRRPRAQSAVETSTATVSAPDVTVDLSVQASSRSYSSLPSDNIHVIAEEDEALRLSPDGCSPSSGRVPDTEDNSKPIVADVAPKAGDAPSPPKIVEPKPAVHVEVDSGSHPGTSRDGVDGPHPSGSGEGAELADDFDEEDIDNLFAEARKERTGRLSGHLSPTPSFHSQVSSDSLTSTYSEAGADYSKHEITGELQFSLMYSRTTGVLTLTLHQCRDLVPVNKKKKISDPYIKAYLVSASQRTNKCKTKVKKGTVNPRFDETFRYTLSEMDLDSKTLQLSVWSFHRVGNGDFLGEINIPLSTFPFSDNPDHEQWLPLQPKPQTKKRASKASKAAPPKETPPIPKSPGTPSSDTPNADPAFRVALQYLPGQAKGSKAPKGELQVKIHSARNLPPTKTGLPDPYVKCMLMPEKSKHKTATIKKTVDPVWDEVITFYKITMDELAESALELTLWDYDTYGYDDLIGALRFNLGKGTSHDKEVDWMDAKGQQKLIWESMINNPSTWVDLWFSLRH